MVRGKTQMRRIENATSRQVTFSKRRNGLLKKAFELSVLCDAEVALIIFSPRGKLYEFASSSMQETIERYRKHTKDTPAAAKSAEENVQNLKQEAAILMKKIDILEEAKRKFLGEGIGSYSLEDLQQIEQQLEKSVITVRARKSQVFKEQIEQLKEKEKALVAENAILSNKCGMVRNLATSKTNNKDKDHQRRENHQAHQHYAESSSPSSDVETELFIGLPETRTRQQIN
ncbi:MADS-box protein soc1 [Stylosanthes scabra]|uniref:MADS-box protein soc1 n=1 Tax=Stylosanthes scabra TaxID=79078 RepID=A0ABU6VEQ5_9FABA|nr:MADS-box protein soc1 [Stylosanthes scabra]